MPLGLLRQNNKSYGDSVAGKKVRTIAVGTEERHRLGSSLGSTCLLCFATCDVKYGVGVSIYFGQLGDCALVLSSRCRKLRVG